MSFCDADVVLFEVNSCGVLHSDGYNEGCVVVVVVFIPYGGGCVPTSLVCIQCSCCVISSCELLSSL